MPIPASLHAHSAFFSDTSLRFAGQLMQEAPTGDDSADYAVAVAAALVCEAQQQGHVCVDLSSADDGNLLPLPELGDWQTLLKQSPLVSQTSNNAPLVLQGSRLYLGRYWYYEQLVAHKLRELAQDEQADGEQAATQSVTVAENGELDWQRVAVAIALRKRLAIISGGPGTGKTTTLVNILAALKTANPSLDIAMAAPTGKAAGRMQEALQGAIKQLSPELQASLPAEAVTLHRLLGVRHGSVYFKHNNHKPLNADVVVVDEASMVDLAMMAKLLAALKPDARLILLGDRDQLASVEAGSVLGDICALQGREATYSPAMAEWLQQQGLAVQKSCNRNALADCIVVLQKSYRFSATSGIGALSRAVNGGDESAAALVAEQYDDVVWQTTGSVSELIAEPVIAHWRRVMDSGSADEALAVMESFRVLTALHSGPRGVEQVNASASQLLRRAGVLQPEPEADYYRGQPLMMSRNDNVSGLANGDTGIIWPDGQGLLRFYYRRGGETRSLATARLPECETVFAMTVHKSQGSEFDEVQLLMPEVPSPVATRELLYTAITRARQRVRISAPSRVFSDAVAKTVQRSSGLMERLVDA